MRLVVVSGLSGSGKTVALHTLEDAGAYCVDNLPLGLLESFVERMLETRPRLYEDITVAIDARSGPEELARFPDIVAKVRDRGVAVLVVFLSADVDTLLQRFSETRRKHPLSRRGVPLIEAIHLERTLLGPVLSSADLVIDTSRLNVHQLRATMRERIEAAKADQMAVLLQSFGYKHGLPTDTDFIFDVRCLPNPHWESRLRPLTGLDAQVAEFLEQHEPVERMFEDIRGFLIRWIPMFEAENRAYMTVSIGCTGGQHRSVYFVERLASTLRSERESVSVSVRHRELAS
jgi:UPF0042 nucleotide-binding protein